jgi:hypothetical protein
MGALPRPMTGVFSVRPQPQSAGGELIWDNTLSGESLPESWVWADRVHPLLLIRAELTAVNLMAMPSGRVQRFIFAPLLLCSAATSLGQRKRIHGRRLRIL